MSTRILRVLGVVFAAALLVAACGDDDDTTAATGGESTENGESTGDDDQADDGTTDGDAAAPVQERDTSLGTVLVDAEGLTLYGFTPDEGGTPTCTDACADTWPPLFTDSDEVPEGLDTSVFSVVEHPSGEPQLAAGGWPLYYYANDAAPGDVSGQGVGGNWFVVAPDGSLIEESNGAEGDSDDAESGAAESDQLDY